MIVLFFVLYLLAITNVVMLSYRKLNYTHPPHMQPEKSDLIAFLTKVAFKIVPPFIVGLMAKVANDKLEGRKLSFLGWVAIAFLTLSGTFLSNWICEYYNLEKNPTLIINAFATMFSEQIFKILFHNFFSIVRDWAKENLKLSLRMMDDGKNTRNTEKDKPTGTND